MAGFDLCEFVVDIVFFFLVISVDLKKRQALKSPLPERVYVAVHNCLTTHLAGDLFLCSLRRFTSSFFGIGSFFF